MKRILAVLLVLVLSTVTFSFAAAEYSRETFFEMGLTALENMDAESAALAAEHFRAASGYQLAPSYWQYSQSLQEILSIDENPDISMAIYRLQELALIDQFTVSLEEHQFPSCLDLVAYAEGRQLEHDENYAEARRKYGAIPWVLDAMNRRFELTPKAYEQGKRLLEEKQYAAAAATLDGLNWQDSNDLYQQAYRIVHPNAEVTVRYVTEDGTELHSDVITITPNHTATAQAQEFDGYRLLSNGTVTITVDDYGVATPKSVTFTYKAIPPSAEITVTEQTQDGRILNSKMVTIKTGTTESIKANTYSDYEVTGNGSAKVSVNSDGIPSQNSVIFTYKEKARVQVGEYITFGHYPQTAAGTDRTPIEWLVLDVQGNKALLISRYGLDAKPYNEKYVGITWEKCTLRAWLNGTFLNKAFTAQERSGIMLTDVDNGNSQGYGDWSTSNGNDTQDKVFLLSYAEAYKYLGVTNNDSRNMKSRVAPTAYALEQGAYKSKKNKTADGTNAGWWWLRSPGFNRNYAARVNDAGSLYSSLVDSDSVSVRPALWINLESDIF